MTWVSGREAPWQAWPGWAGDTPGSLAGTSVRAVGERDGLYSIEVRDTQKEDVVVYPQLPTKVCDRCWCLFLWAMINESPSDMLSPANAAAVCVRRAEPAAVWRRDRHALRCPHEYASRELAPFHVGNTVCGRVSAPIARCCSLEPSPGRRHQRPRMLDVTSPVPCVSGLHQHHSTTASTPHSISAAASA